MGKEQRSLCFLMTFIYVCYKDEFTKTTVNIFKTKKQIDELDKELDKELTSRHQIELFIKYAPKKLIYI